jgi:hypothetical protein
MKFASHRPDDCCNSRLFSRLAVQDRYSWPLALRQVDLKDLADRLNVFTCLRFQILVMNVLRRMSQAESPRMEAYKLAGYKESSAKTNATRLMESDGKKAHVWRRHLPKRVSKHMIRA